MVSVIRSAYHVQVTYVGYLSKLVTFIVLAGGYCDNKYNFPRKLKSISRLEWRAATPAGLAGQVRPRSGAPCTGPLKLDTIFLSS
jgi:hypothetical protein